MKSFTLNHVVVQQLVFMVTAQVGGMVEQF